MNDLAALLASLHQVAETLCPGEAPGFIGALESLKAKAWARLIGTAHAGVGNGQPEGPGEDRLLTVAEAAQKLGLSRDYLYRHAQALPFTVRIPPRQLRFSLRGIERYIRQRQGAR